MNKVVVSPRIQQLFSLYAQNWMNVKRHPQIRIIPDEDNVFLCPLCLYYFTDEALQYTDTLSLEHVPPQSMGGTDGSCTLTCTKCNNEAGTKLEAHLKTKLLIDDVFARLPGTSLEVQYTPVVEGEEDIWLAATYQNEVDGIAVIGDPKRSNPQLLNQVVSKDFAGRVSGLKIRFKTPAPRRAAVALLKTAYLYLFRILGYSAIMTPAMRSVREQIQNPLSAPIDGMWFREYTFPDEILGVNVIREPQEFRSWLVVFDLKSSHSVRRFGVFLPAPQDAALQIYAQLSTLSRGATVAFDMTHIAEEARLISDSAACFYAYNTWGSTTFST